MKRRLALLLATAMLGTVGLLGPASPASATVGPDVCAGQGTATLALGLGYPGLHPAKLTTFFFTFTVGTCVSKATLSATGHVHGWCGHSTGSGVTSNGAAFHFISEGGTLEIFGHLVGVVNAVPAPGTGMCTEKTATSFLINGSVTLTSATLPDGCEDLPPTWNCL